MSAVSTRSVAMKNFMRVYNTRIERQGADKLLEWLMSTDFFTAPASTRFHLSEPEGLCKHSLHVYDRLRYLCMTEQDHNDKFTMPSEETIAIAGLLHDVCKAEIYVQEWKNRKTYDADKVAAASGWQVKHDAAGAFVWESVLGYAFDDKYPYGHGEKSVFLITKHMKLTDEEAFAIRWHMGFTDPSAKDVSNVFERYPLALLLHMADLQATYLDERSKQ